MPTISGRASAADDIKTPAPMVAARAIAILAIAILAIAILIDIISSTFARLARSGALKCLQTMKMAGLPSRHAFLTACLNRMVSTPGPRLVSMGGTKEMFELK